MSDNSTHSTLRELRDHMSSTLTLTVCVGVAAVLTLMAPFETEHSLTLVQRFVYWSIVVVLSYSVGFAINNALSGTLTGRYPRIAVICICSVLTGIGVAITVGLINWVALSYTPRGTELWGFLVNTVAIALIISIVFHVIFARTSPANAEGPPPVLDRLPFEKRGALVALSVEDHYVRIRTTKGEEIILMRLSDAIREVGDTKGMQVHRSHWVATDRIVSVHRDRDRTLLGMVSGAPIPVSRSNMPKLREAGFLPG